MATFAGTLERWKGRRVRIIPTGGGRDVIGTLEAVTDGGLLITSDSGEGTLVFTHAIFALHEAPGGVGVSISGPGEERFT